MNQRLKGNILLLITAAIWGTAFVAQSIGVDSISPSLFNGIRSIIGAAVLLPLVLAVSRKKLKQTESVKYTIIGGIICGIILCLASTLQTAGLKTSTAGKAAFITSLYIVIVPLLSAFSGKKITLVTASAVAVATLGMYLLCGGGSFYLGFGEIVVFISAILFSIHILAVDKFITYADGIAMSCIQFATAGILNLLFSVIFEKLPDISLVISCWLPIVYAGAFSCGIAYTLQIIGQKYADPTPASLIMSLESVFAAIGGWIILHEVMTVSEIIGCLIMFAAIVIVQLPSRK